MQFQAAVEHAARDLGITVFVEIGPHPVVLRDYVLQCGKALDRPVSAVATLRRPATGRPESDEANLWLALCTCHSRGATDVAVTYERPARPVPRVPPGPGRVELRVVAAGLNFRDVLWTMGMLPEEAVGHGFSGPTIGMECAGEVLAIGDGMSGLSLGDRVVAFASSTFSSHVTTDAGAVVRIPDGISPAEAATIPTTFLTAWYALDYLARLRPGERVLIHGATGGVGLAAVQIAKLRGAEVFGTAGSDEKRRVLRLLGVDHVLNSRSLAFADDVMRITGGKGVDVVLNSLAGEAITKNLGLLEPFGRFLDIAKRDLYANSRIGLRPFRNNLSYFGIDADTLLVG